MREIRFRAWDDSISKMIDWDELSKRCMDGHSYYGLDLILKGESHHYHGMQYTGLKDKNGKEIYEGDIVAFMDGGYISTENGIDTNEFMSTGKIEWCDERKGWDVTNREDVDTDECFDEYMEVIGNIYETPELLKP